MDQEMDLFEKMLDLTSQGYYCAQILMILALEMDGKENPDLIRAMSGLNGGLGFSGDVCGCLTGGCSLLGYFSGKGAPEETAHPDSIDMIQDLVLWFQENVGEVYGSIKCDDILEGNPVNKRERCPEIVEGVFGKCLELLQEKNLLG